MKPLPAEAEEFLGSLRSERGLSLNTVAAYRRDLLDYFTFLDAAGESGTVAGFAEDLTRSGLGTFDPLAEAGRGSRVSPVPRGRGDLR